MNTGVPRSSREASYDPGGNFKPPSPKQVSRRTQVFGAAAGANRRPSRLRFACGPNSLVNVSCFAHCYATKSLFELGRIANDEV